MPSDSTLSIIVRLQDEASAQLAALSAKMGAVSDEMTSKMGSVGAAFSNAGDKLTAFGGTLKSAGTSLLPVSAAIAAVGYETVTMAAKFQQSMELIRTQAGASQAEVDAMTKSVLALASSGQTGQGPQALADGLYHLESLGLRGAQAMDALKTSAEAADTGIANMEGVTSALGAALVTGISGTESMDKAMGTLDATIGAGNMRMEDLVAALGTGVLPAAKNFGLTLTDVGAALATLTDNGMRADESATRLRMTFSLMAAPTKKASEELASIGLSTYQLANDMRKPDGLVTALTDLKTHLEDSGKSATDQAAVLSGAFGGGRTSAAILTLVQQLDRVKTKYEQINDQAGEFNDKVQATHETNQYKLNAALAQMQSIMIDIGGTVLPIVVQLMQKLSTGLQAVAAWWDKLSPGMKTFIVDALAIVAAAAPVLIVLGSIITAIGTLATAIGAVITFLAGSTGLAGALAAIGIVGTAPVWLVVAAVVALGAAAYEVWKHWDMFKAAFLVIVNDIKNAWGAVIDWMSDKMLGIAKAWNDTWTSIGAFFKQVWTDVISWFNTTVVAPIQSAIQAIIAAFNNMVSIVSTPVHVVSNAVGGVVNAVGSAVSKIAGHEMGGFIDAPRGTAVPIIAHGGEQVIPAEQTAGRRGGGSVTIQIVNPVVRRSSDLDDMRKMVEQVVRPLLMNAKIAHV